MINMAPLTTEMFGHLVNAVKRRLNILFVYQLH